MSVLFFLLPKGKCAYINETDSIRQAIEKMEHHNYTAIPILSSEGKYISTLSNGDILYFLKENSLDLQKIEHINVMKIKIRKETKPIFINQKMDSLVELIINQNFIPVIDDQKTFIGIVTRKKVIEYLTNKDLH